MMRTLRTCSAEQVGRADRMSVMGSCGGSSARHWWGSSAAPAALSCRRQPAAAAARRMTGTSFPEQSGSARDDRARRQRRLFAAASGVRPCCASWRTGSSPRRSRCQLSVHAVSGTAAGGTDGGQHLLSMLGQLMAGMQRQQQAAPTGSHLAVRGLSFQPAGADLFASTVMTRTSPALSVTAPEEDPCITLLSGRQSGQHMHQLINGFWLYM